MDVAGILPDLEPVSAIGVSVVNGPGLGNGLVIGIGRELIAHDDVPKLVDHGTTIEMRYRH
jgi:hypothetical protein